MSSMIQILQEVIPGAVGALGLGLLSSVLVFASPRPAAVHVRPGRNVNECLRAGSRHPASK